MIELQLFTLGVAVALVSVIPGAVALLAVVWYSLGVARGAVDNRDQWQEAAAGASIAAAVAQDQVEQHQAGGKGKVVGSMHSIWHGDECDSDGGGTDLDDGEDEQRVK